MLRKTFLAFKGRQIANFMHIFKWKVSVIADLYREVTTDRSSTVSLFQFKCSISKRTVHDEVSKSTGPKWCYNLSLYRNRTDLLKDGGRIASK